MNNWLQMHKWNYTSQKGEDGILNAIFSTIGVSNFWCIECGAGNGQFLSNTNFLITKEDWYSVQIEKDSTNFEQLKNLYKDNPKVLCYNTELGFTINNGFDNILNQIGCPKNPDLCIIDVDSIDYYLWLNMIEYKPRVIMIEFNPTIPFWETIIQPPNSISSYGCSLQALVELGKNKGYELATVTDWNAIFVEQNSFGCLKIENNSIWELGQHLTKYLTNVIQTFDNKTILTGWNKKLWCRNQKIFRRNRLIGD